VAVDDADEANLGSDEYENEIIVLGGLTVSGTSGSPVVFESSQASPAEGDWYGITTDPLDPATLSIRYATIRHAQVGLIAADVNTSEVAHCTFSDNEVKDLWLSASSSLPMTVDSDTVVVGGGDGIYIDYQAGGCVISNNVIEGNASSSDGIVRGAFGSSSTGTFSHNTITGFSYGKGINITSGLPTFIKNVTANGKYGIYVAGGNPTIGTVADTTSDNISTGNTTAGLYVTGSGTTGTVRESRFTGNGTGVITKGNSNPNLGDSSQNGLNIFEGNSTHCLWNQSSSGTVSARGNYLGSCSPPAICWSGSFDLNGTTCSVPSQTPVEVTAALPSRGKLIGVFPNPMETSARIRFRAGDENRPVRLEIYDVSGRLVRRFGGVSLEPGEHEVIWNGRSDSGVPVANGLYFIRLLSGDVIQGTGKVLLASH
jgi:Right handed beta helix region/FlgD Ig-like domain